MVLGADGGTESTGLTMLAWVVSVLICAGIGPLSSNGERPILMNGLVTGAGACQATDIWVVGSAPYAMCRPNGVTNCPPGWSVLVSKAGVDRRAGRVGAADALWASRAGPAIAAPAPMTPPRSSERREVALRNHSCCSARLMRFAWSGVMREE